MKFKFMMVVAGVLLVCSGFAYAAEGESMNEGQDMMMEEQKVLPANVGNKICPVSGEKIGSMGEGMTVEHDGKIYNLCCSMCERDFKANSEAFIMKINEELKKLESVDIAQ